MRRGARILGAPVSDDGAREIARRARGTPRVAGRLLRRVHDFAVVEGAKQITSEIADRALLALEVDAHGLDTLDRRYLTMIAENFSGGPVGIETISAALSEPRDAIEDIVEPYLIQQGFVQRTPRGRLLTLKAFGHLGLARAVAGERRAGRSLRRRNGYSERGNERPGLSFLLQSKLEDAMKTEKEKAKEVLKERERARKGFAVTNDEGEDPLEKPGELDGTRGEGGRRRSRARPRAEALADGRIYQRSRVRAFSSPNCRR